MGRRSSGGEQPFRFILDLSNATAANVYLVLYPKPILRKALGNDRKLLELVWQVLNEIRSDVLVSEGRVYGGGLYKLEPKELANAPADGVMSIQDSLSGNYEKQLALPLQ